MNTRRVRTVAVAVVLSLAVVVSTTVAVLATRGYVVARDRQTTVTHRLAEVQIAIHRALGEPFTTVPEDVPQPDAAQLAEVQQAIDALRADASLFDPATLDAIDANWQRAQRGGAEMLFGATAIDAALDSARAELIPAYMARADRAARNAALALVVAALVLMAAVTVLVHTLLSRSRDRARARAEHFYSGMLESLPDRVCRFRVEDLVITYCNEAWARPFGLVPDHAIGRPMADLVGGDALRLVELLVDARLRGHDGEPTEYPLVDTEGSTRLELWEDRLVEGDDGRPELLAIGRDITERARAERDLATSEQRFRSLADRASDVVFQVRLGSEPTLLYVNQAVVELTGYEPERFYRSPLAALMTLIRPEDQPTFGTVVRRFFDDDVSEDFELRLVRADGELRWVDVRRTFTSTRDGEVIVDGAARDITESKRTEAELARMAHQDALTGLPNRRALLEDLAERLDDRPGVAVLFVDLDGFKQVNDTLGHDAGDRVLVEVARRLTECCRHEDLVARLGGDEFVVLTEPDLGEVLGHRILQALARPLGEDGLNLVVTGSVGVAVGHRGISGAALVDLADRAMYEAKLGGKARVHVAGPELLGAPVRRGPATGPDQALPPAATGDASSTEVTAT